MKLRRAGLLGLDARDGMVGLDVRDGLVGLPEARNELAAPDGRVSWRRHRKQTVSASETSERFRVEERRSIV